MVTRTLTDHIFTPRSGRAIPERTGTTNVEERILQSVRCGACEVQLLRLLFKFFFFK